MPTNLPPEAQAAYSRHMDATTLEEKIRTLEEFLSLVPKHKGTEKLIALHRSRLVKLRQELEKKKAELLKKLEEKKRKKAKETK